MSKTKVAKNGTFINHYPAGMIHINKAKNKNGTEREFASVSFSCRESKNGYGTFSVNMKQLLPATKKDGSVIDGRYSIFLGEADKERTVSIATNNPINKAQRKYIDIRLTNAQIAEYINAARNEYSLTQTATA